MKKNSPWLGTLAATMMLLSTAGVANAQSVHENASTTPPESQTINITPGNSNQVLNDVKQKSADSKVTYEDASCTDYPMACKLAVKDAKEFVGDSYAVNTAVTLKKVNGDYLAASVPVIGEGVVEDSMAVIMFDSSGKKLLGYETIIGTEQADGSQKFRVDANGARTTTVNISAASVRTMDAAAQTADQPAAANQGFTQKISIFSRCLERHGVKASVATAAAIACVGGLPACAETAGVGCLICAGAAGFVGGAVLGHCAALALKG